jgi:ABC-type multidrug transport system ATPase subunit
VLTKGQFGYFGNNNKQVSGKVTYNGHEMNEFVPERTAAYISQHDLHLGEMTVRETLEFSARCQGVGTRYGMKYFLKKHCITHFFLMLSKSHHKIVDMITELARREKEANIKPDPDIDVFMKVTQSTR